MPPRPTNWTTEEDSFLLLVYRAPDLYRLWKQKAIKEGWTPRSHAALMERSQFLRNSKPDFDDFGGWVTARQLQRYLSTNIDTIHRWIKLGLPAYRDGNSATSRIKIHLAEFVQWVLSPSGSSAIAHHIKNDELAINWVFQQVATWKDEKPIKAKHSSMKVEPRKLNQSA